MYATELEQKQAVTKDGTVIGKTTDAVMDTNAWKLVAIEVDLDGDIAEELQLKKLFRSPRVPLPVDLIEAVGDKILLKSGKGEISSVLAAAAAQ